MPSSPRSKMSLAFFAQYGASLLNGLMSFIVVAFAAHQLDNAAFSRLSMVLLQFSAYQICLDLGTHNLHVHRLAHAAREHWALHNLRLLHTRFGLAALAFLVALCHVWIGGFSAEVRGSFLIMVGSFFFASFASSRDSFLFAAGREAEAVWLRASRIAALLGLLLSIVLFPDAKLTSHFLVFFGVMVVAGIWALAGFVREESVPRAWRDFSKTQALDGTGSFDPWLVATYLGFAAFPIATNVIVVHVLGEGSLSLWNAALTTATPLTLALQTWVALMTRPYSENFASISLRRTSESRFRWGHVALSLMGLLGYALVLRLGIFQSLLRRPEAAFAPLVMAMAAWQCLWILPSMAQLYLQFSRKTHLFLVTSVASYVAGLSLAFFLGRSLQEFGLVLGLLLQALVWTLLIFGVVAVLKSCAVTENR